MGSFLFLLLFGSSYFGFSKCDHLGFRVSSPQHGEIGFKKEVYENIRSDQNCKKDYVDPNDMLNYVHGSKKMLPSDRKNCPGTSLSKGCENCASHMQRFVGLFLRATGLKDYVLIRSNSKRVHLDFIVEQKDLEVLQLFADTGKVDLTVINEALSNILTGGGNLYEDRFTSNNFDKEKGDASTDSYFNTVLKPFLIILLRLPHEFPQHCITVCVTVVFGITLWQILNSRSWKLSIFSLIFLIFSSGFGWNWWKMYQIADAKRISSRMLKDSGSGIPIYCQPDKMTWYQYVYYYYTYEKECEEYFKRELVDPIVEVSPTIVLAETFSTFILYPADKIGFAVGSFTSALLDAVPWPYKIFVVPIILIFMAIFIIIISVILVGGKLTFRIPFSSFEIGSNPAHHRSERQFIEDVRPQMTSPSINQQNKTEITGSEESKNTTKGNPRKEISDLFKRFKEIELAENGSGDKSVNSSSHELVSSNVLLHKSENDSDFGRYKTSNTSGSSEVHLHVHIPKCGGDGSNVTCIHKEEIGSRNILLEGKDPNDDVNIFSIKTKSVAEADCKNKEESDESENSEFEKITKTELCDIKRNN